MGKKGRPTSEQEKGSGKFDCENRKWHMDWGRGHMNRKVQIKILLDAAMTLLLLFLMGYQLWGEAAHEWAGAAIFLSFILHNILNLAWYRNLFRGRYNPMRTAVLAVNVLLILSMICLMISSVILSRYVFAFLPVHGFMSLGRRMHMAAAYWGFGLMAAHLGLHWNMLLGMAGRLIKGEIHSAAARLAAVLAGTGIAIYGLTVFIKRDLLIYMFLRTEFVFLDYDEPKILFYLNYLALMGLFIYIAHYGLKLLKKV